MNPWIAHLENQDLKWIVDHGQGVYLDPGIDVHFPKPTLILDGQLECRSHVRGSGALLGISEWYLEVDRGALWGVKTPATDMDEETRKRTNAILNKLVRFIYSPSQGIENDDTEDAQARRMNP